MSDARQEADADRRVEELLRVNAALAAEVRSLVLGRTDAPRSAAIPTSRRLAVLLEERDSFAEQLEVGRVELAEVRADRDRLEAQNREMDQEIARLSEGIGGFLRRLRARALARLRRPA
jgi:hypothetical protein